MQLIVQEVGSDGRIILGVADWVPTEAELDRLESVPALVGQAV